MFGNHNNTEILVTEDTVLITTKLWNIWGSMENNKSEKRRCTVQAVSTKYLGKVNCTFVRSELNGVTPA